MQTSRHEIFALLALGAACCPHPRSGSGAVEPELGEVEDDQRTSSRRPGTRPSVGEPRLARAGFSSLQTLELHFTEPVTPTSGIVSGQFRLSYGEERSEPGYALTYYSDPGELDRTGQRRVSFVELRALDDQTLQLHLATPMPPEVCEAADELREEGMEDPGVRGGLYLHYRDAAGGIESRAGKRLADIAPHWITRDATSAVYGGSHLPIEAFGPIPCPRG